MVEIKTEEEKCLSSEDKIVYDWAWQYDCWLALMFLCIWEKNAVIQIAFTSCCFKLTIAVSLKECFLPFTSIVLDSSATHKRLIYDFISSKGL